MIIRKSRPNCITKKRRQIRNEGTTVRRRSKSRPSVRVLCKAREKALNRRPLFNSTTTMWSISNPKCIITSNGITNAYTEQYTITGQSLAVIHDADETKKKKKKEEEFIMNKFNNIMTALVDNFKSPIINKLICHFGFLTTMSQHRTNYEAIHAIYDFFIKYNTKVHKLIKGITNINVNNEHPMLYNIWFTLKFDSQTFGVVLIGEPLKCFYNELYYNKSIATTAEALENIDEDTLGVYIFGKHAVQYTRRLRSIIHESLTSNTDSDIEIYTVSPNRSSEDDISVERTVVKGRSMNSIFMDDAVLTDITHHIDTFLRNKDLYIRRGIIYKTGILLYGETGTGKTSLIKSLSSKYRRPIVMIDMPSFPDLNINELSSAINADVCNFIVVLEDIDCIIADRENKDIDKEDKQVVNKLLQLLDSNSSPNDVIFIATTNHPELLDEALTREARFDIRKEIKGIYKDKAIEMCKSFDLTEQQIENVLSEIQNMGIDLTTTRIRQSKLQKLILDQMSVGALIIEEELDDEQE